MCDCMFVPQKGWNLAYIHKLLDELLERFMLWVNQLAAFMFCYTSYLCLIGILSPQIYTLCEVLVGLFNASYCYNPVQQLLHYAS